MIRDENADAVGPPCTSLITDHTQSAPVRFADIAKQMGLFSFYYVQSVLSAAAREANGKGHTGRAPFQYKYILSSYRTGMGNSNVKGKTAGKTSFR